MRIVTCLLATVMARVHRQSDQLLPTVQSENNALSALLLGTSGRSQRSEVADMRMLALCTFNACASSQCCPDTQLYDMTRLRHELFITTLHALAAGLSKRCLGLWS